MISTAQRPPFAPRPAPRGVLVSAALALTFLAHCSFPEYSFRVSEQGESGAAGGQPSAGRGGTGGSGGGQPSGGSGGGGTMGGATGGSGGSAGAAAGSAGAAGAAGSGGGGCTQDCEFDVASGGDLFGLVSDGNEVFWVDCDTDDTPVRCTLFAKSADGTGQVRTVATPDQLPEDDRVLVNLQADANSIYALLLPPPPRDPNGLVRIPKAGGNAQVLLDGGSNRVFFNYAVGNQMIFAFRDDVSSSDEPPGSVVLLEKLTGVNSVISSGAFSLVGVDADKAVVVDNASGDLRLIAPNSSTVVLPGSAHPSPRPLEGAVDAAGYYFVVPGQARSLDRGGDEISFLSLNAGNNPRFVSVDGDSLYWINDRTDENPSGNPTGDVHAIGRAGGDVRKLAIDVSPEALSVKNGFAYWISASFTRIVGRRL